MADCLPRPVLEEPPSLVSCSRGVLLFMHARSPGARGVLQLPASRPALCALACTPSTRLGSPARQLLLQPPPPPPASVGASSASNIPTATGGGGSPTGTYCRWGQQLAAAATNLAASAAGGGRYVQPPLQLQPLWQLQPHRRRRQAPPPPSPAAAGAQIGTCCRRRQPVPRAAAAAAVVMAAAAVGSGHYPRHAPWRWESDLVAAAAAAGRCLQPLLRLQL